MLVEKMVDTTDMGSRTSVMVENTLIVVESWYVTRASSLVVVTSRFWSSRRTCLRVSQHFLIKTFRCF